jgi:hypothetical protein
LPGFQWQFSVPGGGLLVLLLCRAGLRRSEAVGLRREDIHFLVDSSGLGCGFPGSHLHVVRRDNINGAWAKSRHSRTVPVDGLVGQAHDQYVLEPSVEQQVRPARRILVRHTPQLSALTAYSAKGLSTWTPANSKSLTLRVTTVMPCTRAVAAMSASITGRGCAYC